MSFNHFQFYGNHWESATEQLEERIRQLRGAAHQDPPDEDIPEAEIDDSERREAMARERYRRRLR